MFWDSRIQASTAVLVAVGMLGASIMVALGIRPEFLMVTVFDCEAMELH